MSYDPTKHHRRSVRLKGYDYSQPGAYFVTINTHLGQPLFGEITNGVIRLNECGSLVEKEWLQTAAIRKNIELDVFTIMPDHFHGILVILEDEEEKATQERAHIEAFGRSTAGALPTIVRAFKSAVTRRINQVRRGNAISVWHRGFYEHVIRNDEDLNRITEYILGNPIKEL